VENLFATLDDLWHDVKELVLYLAPDPTTFVRISLRVPPAVESAVWASARDRRWTVVHRLSAAERGGFPAPTRGPLRVLAANLSDRSLPASFAGARLEGHSSLELVSLSAGPTSARAVHLTGCRRARPEALKWLETLVAGLAAARPPLIILEGGPGTPVDDRRLLDALLEVGAMAVLSHGGAGQEFFAHFYQNLAVQLPIDLAASGALQASSAGAGAFRLWLRPGGELGLLGGIDDDGREGAQLSQGPR